MQYKFFRKKKTIHPANPNSDTLIDASVTVYHRGSKPVVQVPLGVHLPILSRTLTVRDRREIYINIPFISKNVHISVNMISKSRYMLIFKNICD